MILWVLTATLFDEAKEPEGVVIGVFDDFSLMADEATRMERVSTQLNPPQYGAASFELNKVEAQQIWIRHANGEWERIPRPEH